MHLRKRNPHCSLGLRGVTNSAVLEKREHEYTRAGAHHEGCA